jgi:DNA-binding NtrC family response regulator
MEPKDSRVLARLLLIDDDPAGLLALAEMIQRRLSDVTVDTTLDVHAALDLLRQKDYHVIVSDIRMAGLDGLAALNQVRERWPQVHVILMTAGGREREQEAAREGAYAFIQKPINQDELLPMLVDAIERSVLLYRVDQANRRSRMHLEFEAGRMDLGVDPTLEKGPRRPPADK